MRRLAPLVAVFGLVALPLVARAATTHQVDIEGRAYDPASLTVTSGDTVRWTNRDLENHTVTFTTDTQSEPILPANSRTITFHTPGTYRYRCDFHPAMQGSVVVRASASSSSTSTTRPTTTSTTQDARGSAITAPPETSTPTTTSTTTTTTTTTIGGEESSEPPDDVRVYEGPTGNPDDVDGPGAVAALLLLATAGGAFLVTRKAFP